MQGRLGSLPALQEFGDKPLVLMATLCRLAPSIHVAAAKVSPFEPFPAAALRMAPADYDLFFFLARAMQSCTYLSTLRKVCKSSESAIGECLREGVRCVCRLRARACAFVHCL